MLTLCVCLGPKLSRYELLNILAEFERLKMTLLIGMISESLTGS